MKHQDGDDILQKIQEAAKQEGNIQDGEYIFKTYKEVVGFLNVLYNN